MHILRLFLIILLKKKNPGEILCLLLLLCCNYYLYRRYARLAVLTLEHPNDNWVEWLLAGRRMENSWSAPTRSIVRSRSRPHATAVRLSACSVVCTARPQLTITTKPRDGLRGALLARCACDLHRTLVGQAAVGWGKVTIYYIIISFCCCTTTTA